MKPEIYYPLNPFFINQHWGENLPCVRDYGLPTQTIVTGTQFTCPAGYTKLYEHFFMSGHNGVDLRAGEQPVYSAMPGVVIEKQTVPARGLGLGILSLEPYDFPEGKFYIKLRYWHLKSFNVEVGAQVKVGDVIAITDNTGYSSGNHLHFEAQLYRKDAGGHPSLVTVNDDYGNTINPEPYFIGKYANEAQVTQFTKNLYFGLQSADVKELQRVLGVYPQTGFFGPITLYSVLKYQVAHGIPPTGFVGPITRNSLNTK